MPDRRRRSRFVPRTPNRQDHARPVSSLCTLPRLFHPLRWWMLEAKEDHMRNGRWERCSYWLPMFIRRRDSAMSTHS
jgi:hypothetical protein